MLQHELTGDIHARVPVLLLRPLAGTVALWGRFHDELARSRPLIACHHRGIGRSPAAALPTTTRGMASDAAALLDHLDVRGAYVFGLSLGGMVATWLAIDRPDLVRGLVLASAPARGLAVLSPRALGFVVPFVRAGDVGLAERVLSARFRREQPARTSEILDQIRTDAGSLRTTLLHGAAAALHDPTRALTRLRAPTLCLAGALDTLVSPASIADLARRLPHGRFERIDGAGHDLSLEAPGELARRVTRFLDHLELAGVEPSAEQERQRFARIV